MRWDIWTVVCDHPDGGDVIEGRLPPVVTTYKTREEALDCARSWYREGPNGPVRSARVLLHGAPARVLHGPPELVKIEPYRLFDEWHASIKRVTGEERAGTSNGGCLNREEALREARESLHLLEVAP